MPYRVVELSLSRKAMLLTSQGTAVHACMYVQTMYTFLYNYKCTSECLRTYF